MKHGWIFTLSTNSWWCSDMVVNSLWPSHTIWWDRSGSILAQVMACCLTAPSRYLTRYWLIINDILWNSPHYNDVIMGLIASQITSLTIVYSVQIKENIKAPRHWPLCGEFTRNRWIPRTNGQLCGNCFHLMTSSCDTNYIGSAQDVNS